MHHFLFPVKLITLCLMLIGCIVSQAVWAYTPESPEVKKLVARGVEFIEKSSKSTRHGENAIVALAMLKSRGSDHPIAKATYADFMKTTPKPLEMNVYEHGLVIIFMGEMMLTLNDTDPSKVAILQTTLDEFLKRQKPHGGYGYDGIGGNGGDRPIGDVSQSQYAALGCGQQHKPAPKSLRKQLKDYVNVSARTRSSWRLAVSRRRSQKQNTHSPREWSFHSFTTCCRFGIGLCVCRSVRYAYFWVESEEEANVPSALKLVKQAKVEQNKLEMASSILIG